MNGEIVMPQLGLTMTEGKVLQWYKKVGDAFTVGEPLYEVETDKVNMDVEATESGQLTEIVGPLDASASDQDRDRPFCAGRGGGDACTKVPASDFTARSQTCGNQSGRFQPPQRDWSRRKDYRARYSGGDAGG